ncbi:DNA-processing protein DprA [Paenibacillus sp. 3LSP]|uniref:DNA-processing protein DprA n=1 Tax=Paenibacillus sp. 3LSP TaxID=2800795 RepID=UPI0028FD9FE7|nr:DNA-processing protein DprA [Paenibacillus sp. 3LSP]MDU0330994.1 DNA-processing protein DprA [Paenibacillus sp. 3LSP]
MLQALHILTLLNLSGYGRNTVHGILGVTEFVPSTLQDLMDIIKDSSEKVARVKVPEQVMLENAYKKAQLSLERCERLGIKVLGFNDPEFPVRLKVIPNPPVLIFVRGNLDSLNSELSVAVIGTREPSSYGGVCGNRFGKIFAEKGLVVVSGLAKGIDTTGHRGCIEGGGQTIAVLAQGLDTPVYPKENRDLAEEIIATGGCLISEYDLGERGRPNFFVERDRLQSGLSAGVVVIETDIKGGTMHTVGFCLEQGKPLGCLNHPEKFLINNDKSRGNQKLIKDGKAIPLFSVDDIELFLSKMKRTSEVQYVPKELPVKKPSVKSNPDDDVEQMTLF